jgi:5,10-methylenetetrahydrofolate reductase
MEKFRDKLKRGEFVYTTEIGPPKGVSMSGIFDELELVRGRVDAINVTDQQSAVMRLGSVAASRLLIEKGYEPICQVTCRDRNRIALQSDVLSAYALGIQNILIMTGDHPLLGDHPDAKPVYDLDSVELLHVIRELHKGSDLAGKKLSSSPSFCVGAVVNPGAEPLEPEIIKMEKKVAGGAVFFQTQAIFDVRKLENFVYNIRHVMPKIKLLGGIVPLSSVKMARYMNANIPGVSIPEETIVRLEKGANITSESVAIAADLVAGIREICDGIHFMPIRANHLVAMILDRIGVKAE